MKKFHSLTAILLALCLTGSLAGCGGNAGTNATESTGQAANPSHIYEEGENGFLVDAEVQNFTDGVPRVYEGSFFIPSREQVEAFFTANADPLTEWEDSSQQKGYLGFHGTTESGSFSFAIHESNMYPGTFFYSTPRGNWWEQYFVYLGQATDDRDYGFMLTDHFTEPKEFAFATAEQAEANVRSSLAALGLTDLMLHRTLYVDCETLAEITTILRDDPDWQPIKTNPDGTPATNPTRDDWTEEDEGYVFEFFFSINGCPMAYASNPNAVSAYMGSSVLVYYQPSGITELTVNCPWVCGELVEETGSYLTAAQALEIIRPRLEYNLERKTTVIKISGEYRYDQDGGRYLLHPVWNIQTQYTTAYLDKPYTEYLSVDAITGEEL